MNENKVYELCSYCRNEVLSNNEYKVQYCPKCKREIKPCSICADNCSLDEHGIRKNSNNNVTVEVFYLVKCFGLIVDDVRPYFKEDEAKIAFKEYTGVDYEAVYGNDGNDGNDVNYELLDDDYDQTKIFCDTIILPLSV